MKITAALRKWIVENCEVKADADDDVLREAVSKAIVAGKLTAEKLSELSVDPDEKEADMFSKKLDQIADGLNKLADIQIKAMEKPGEEKETDEEKAAKEKAEAEKAKAEEEKNAELKQKADRHWYAKMVGDIGSGSLATDEKTYDVRVKEAAESYEPGGKTALIYPNRTKSNKPHPHAGQPVMDFNEHGRAMDTQSDREKAVVGAWSKFVVRTVKSNGSRTLGWLAMSPHEKELILYAMDNMDWGGASDGGQKGDINGRLTPHQKQALIDDAVSGGFEAAPVVFDDAIIETPLLHGELYPKVNVIPITQGRRIEGVQTGTVGIAWGGVDDTAIALFNTAAYVTAFNTTIFRTEGAIRIGLDFLSDTPIDFGAHVTAQYGQRLLEELDDVIATGNGTTQPEGIMIHAGVPAVGFGGATTLGAYETLMFTVAKPERGAGFQSSIVFCGTEVSYRRARAIPIGAGDARRLGGEDYLSWTWMGHPFAVNNSLNNTQIFYAVMKRYRMYRRRGLTMRSSTEGDTLIRRNELLITITARFGGQLERAGAAALTTTAPA